MIHFKGNIEHKGYTYYIWLPEALSKHFTRKGNIPVKGAVNSFPFIGYLCKRAPNRHVLNLHAEIRKTAGLKEFDEVEASIEFDSESRDIPIPEDVEWILKEDPKNWHRFMQLTPSRRNEFLTYILQAKRPETRLKRIELLIYRLNEGNAGKTA